jgi:ribosomal-protein-alanine N-acetyltransferase
MGKTQTIPTLKTNRVVLREFSELDADPLRLILSEPGALRYFPSSKPPPIERVRKIIESHKNHWSEHGFGWWAAVDRADNQLLGWCGLGLLPETDEIEIKYLFKRSHWGRGIATEAAGICIDYAFKEAGLETIVGLTHTKNIASQRVLEKIGLTFRNEAEYFGMFCFRYAVSQEEYAGGS